jgi:hypothetical protein
MMDFIATLILTVIILVVLFRIKQFFLEPWLRDFVDGSPTDYMMPNKTRVRLAYLSIQDDNEVPQYITQKPTYGWETALDTLPR